MFKTTTNINQNHEKNLNIIKHKKLTLVKIMIFNMHINQEKTFLLQSINKCPPIMYMYKINKSVRSKLLSKCISDL